MEIYQIIKSSYPEIEDKEFINGKIRLRDDADGVGVYIEKWEYSKPIPSGLSVGKPTA